MKTLSIIGLIFLFVGAGPVHFTTEKIQADHLELKFYNQPDCSDYMTSFDTNGLPEATDLARVCELGFSDSLYRNIDSFEVNGRCLSLASEVDHKLHSLKKLCADKILNTIDFSAV